MEMRALCSGSEKHRFVEIFVETFFSFWFLDIFKNVQNGKAQSKTLKKFNKSMFCGMGGTDIT